jgi:hypothetical protein
MTNRLAPPKYVWTLKHFTENPFYIDEQIILQNNATTHPPGSTTSWAVKNPCVVSGNSITNASTTAYVLSINQTKTTVYTENLPGHVNIFFDLITMGDPTIGSKITVYDANNTIIASTDLAHNNMSPLTTNDITFLENDTKASEFTKSIVKSNYITSKFTRSTNQDYAVGTGKMSIPNFGGGKTIITIDSNYSAMNYKILIQYPTVTTSDKNTVNDPACNPQPPRFSGTLSAGALTMVQWSCSNIFRVNTTGYKAFVLEATGLKPDTIHKFYMDTKGWPEVIMLTHASFAAAFYDTYARTHFGVDAILANPDLLIISLNRKVNEVNRFLRQSMAGLYNSDGSPGAATVLKTNKYGKIKFLVFFPLNIAGWFSQDFNAPSYRLDYTGFELSRSNYGELLKPTYGSSGYTSLILQDASGTSVAQRIFANRTPNKTIPDDPRGNL